MTKDEIGCILILLTLLAIPVMFIYCIYDCIKKGKKEDAERAQSKLIAEEQLKEEMTKPKSQIRFIDHGYMEHTSKVFDPYVTDNMFLRKRHEYYSVVSSARVAGFALKEAYERGYIRDANGNTYPTCNLHKISIEEAK